MLISSCAGPVGACVLSHGSGPVVPQFALSMLEFLTSNDKPFALLRTPHCRNCPGVSPPRLLLHRTRKRYECIEVRHPAKDAWDAPKGCSPLQNGSNAHVCYVCCGEANKHTRTRRGLSSGYAAAGCISGSIFALREILPSLIRLGGVFS